MAEQLRERGVMTTERLVPELKDWNEDLACTRSGRNLPHA